MSKSIWFVSYFDPYYESCFIGAWTTEPDEDMIFELIHKKYTHLLMKDSQTLTARDACKRSGISEDELNIVKLDIVE